MNTGPGGGKAAAAAPAKGKAVGGGGGYSLDDVAKHATKTDCWVVVNGQVLNVTNFLKDHPGGELAILTFAGKDASEEFNMIHPPDVVGKYAPDALIGNLGAGKAKKEKKAKAAGGAAAAAVAAPAKKGPAGPWYAGDTGKRKVAFLGSLATLTTGACVIS